MAIVSRAPPSESPAKAAAAAARKARRLECRQPSLGKKIEYAMHMYSLQTVLAVPLWLRGWREWMYPPAGRPDIVKAYDCRPALAVRVFFPATYDQTSPQPLPAVFTIHGGGFCIGVSRDDDEYNRALADSQHVLAVSLDYSKSPAATFPTALHDLEAVYHAVVADQSLPLARAGGPTAMATSPLSPTSPAGPPTPSTPPDRRSRIAVLGFSAGGNLALALAQLPSIRSSADAPAAAISVYGCLDLSRAPADKLRNRFYKPALPLPQGSRIDSLASLAPVFDWSYIPYGQDLTDPLLSPAYASLDRLPRHLYLVAAELDMLAHESWRLACRLGNDARRRAAAEGWSFSGAASSRAAAAAAAAAADRVVPDPDSKADRDKCVGKRASSKNKGALEPLSGGDERFGWEDTYYYGATAAATAADAVRRPAASVNWLLVPDVIHGFDNANIRDVMGGEDSMDDAKRKTEKYVERIGAWLHNVVWA